MTRCYEYYCLFECKPDKCALIEKGPDGKKKHRSGISRIRKYIRFMKEKEVTFDKSDNDKTRFYSVVDKYGSEYAVTQNVAVLQHRKIDGGAKIEGIVHDSIENILNHVDPDSVDLILTDPPYAEEYLPLWSILAEKAKVILKTGGFLVAYPGQIHLPNLFLRLCEHLEYVWTFALIHKGARATIHARHIFNAWKPILVFAKPPYDLPWMDDIIQGTGREKEDHEWQQALGEFEELIERFTLLGQLVVDPFLGSGTTVLAAQNTGRNFFGMDIDELAIKTTLGRLAE